MGWRFHLFGPNNIFSLLYEILSMIRENETMLETTPKTLSVRESLYLDSIQRDFPELNLELAKSYVNEIVTDYLHCLESGDTSELEKDCTENMVSQAISRKDGKPYRNLKFHRTVVSDYRKSAAEAKLVFQTACEYTLEMGKKRRKVVQTRFEVQYSYYLKETANNSSEVLRCSYCGAPVEQVGTKICKYCGNGVVDTIKRTWKFSDIREF
ncbi:MAG: hypothetical protein GX234_10385 [Clostridiales bacterium]|nr:hypothetical protein [Clostridiales bacterium]